MFSHDNLDQVSSPHQELEEISNTLTTIGPRIHFYCSKKTSDPSYQEIIQVMLNFYANKILQLESQLNTLKIELDKLNNSILMKKCQDITKTIAANKKYIMQHLIVVKPIESRLQIEHTVRPPKRVTPDSSPAETKHSLFKKHTGALAATTAATLTLGYFYLKNT